MHNAMSKPMLDSCTHEFCSFAHHYCVLGGQDRQRVDLIHCCLQVGPGP